MDPWVGEAQFLKNEMAVCLTRKEKKKTICHDIWNWDKKFEEVSFLTGV